MTSASPPLPLAQRVSPLARARSSRANFARSRRLGLQLLTPASDIFFVDTEATDLFHTAQNICVHAALILRVHRSSAEAWRMVEAAGELLLERARYQASILRRGRRSEDLQ